MEEKEREASSEVKAKVDSIIKGEGSLVEKLRKLSELREAHLVTAEFKDARTKVGDRIAFADINLRAYDALPADDPKRLEQSKEGLEKTKAKLEAEFEQKNEQEKEMNANLKYLDDVLKEYNPVVSVSSNKTPIQNIVEIKEIMVLCLSLNLGNTHKGLRDLLHREVVKLNTEELLVNAVKDTIQNNALTTSQKLSLLNVLFSETSLENRTSVFIALYEKEVKSLLSTLANEYRDYSYFLFSQLRSIETTDIPPGLTEKEQNEIQEKIKASKKDYRTDEVYQKLNREVTSYVNVVPKYIASTVLSGDIEDAQLAIRQWLIVASESVNKKDYLTAYAIYSGLGQSAVSRILIKLPTNAEREMFNFLDKLFEKDKNYKHIREKVENEAAGTFIPPLNLTVKDITSTYEGNPDKGDAAVVANTLLHTLKMKAPPVAIGEKQSPSPANDSRDEKTIYNASLEIYPRDTTILPLAGPVLFEVSEGFVGLDNSKAVESLTELAVGKKPKLSSESKQTSSKEINSKLNEIKTLLLGANAKNIPEQLPEKLMDLVQSLEQKLETTKSDVDKKSNIQKNIQILRAFANELKIEIPRAAVLQEDVEVGALKTPQPVGFFANVQQRIVEASNFVASIFRRDVEAVSEEKPQASEPEASKPKVPEVEKAAESAPAVSQEKPEILQSITWGDYWKAYDAIKAAMENSISVKGKEEEVDMNPLAIHEAVGRELKIGIPDLDDIANLDRNNFELKVNEFVAKGRVKGPTTIETAQKTAVAKVMEELVHINNTFYKDFIEIEPKVIAFTQAHIDDQLVQEFHESYYAILNFFNKVKAISETDPIKKAEIIANLLLDDDGKIAKDIVRFTELKTQVSAKYPQQFTANTEEARAFDNAVILPSQWVTKAVIVLDAVKKEGIDGIDVASNLFKEAASLANKTERVISESVAVKLEQLVAGTSSTSKIPSAVLNAQAEEVEKFLTPQFVNLGGRDKAKSFEQIYALMNAYVEKISGKGGRELTETEVGNIRVILKNLGKLSDFVKQHDPSFAEQQKEIPLGNAIGQLRLAGHKELSEQCSKALLQFNEISISEIVQAEKQTSTPAYLFPGSNITWEKYWETFNRILEEIPAEGAVTEQDAQVHRLVAEELGVEIPDFQDISDKALENSDDEETFRKAFMEHAAGKIAKREKIQEAKAELTTESTEVALDEQTRLVNGAEGLDRIIAIIAPKITDESLKVQLRQKAKILFAQEIDEIAKKESITFPTLKSFLDKKERYEKAGFELPDNYAANYTILVDKLLAQYPVTDRSADLATLVVRLKSFQDGIDLLGPNKRDFESRANELKGVCDAKLEASLEKKLIDLFASNDLAAIKFAGKEDALAQKIKQEKAGITDEMVINKIHVIMNMDGDLLEKAIKLHVLMGNYFEYVGDVSQKLYEEYQLQVTMLTEALAQELYGLDRDFIKQLEIPVLPKDNEDADVKKIAKEADVFQKVFGKSMTSPLIYKIVEALNQNGNVSSAVLMCHQLLSLCEKAGNLGDVHAMYSVFMIFQDAGMQKIIPAFLETCSASEKALYEDLRERFSSEKNMDNLRKYQSSPGMKIPFMGIWGKDIVGFVNTPSVLDNLPKIYKEIQTVKESVQDAKVVQKPNWYRDETKVTEQQSKMAGVVLGAAIPAEMPKRLPEFSKQDKRFYQTASIEERIKKYEGKEDDASVAAYKLLEALIKFRKESKKVVHEKYLNVLKQMVSKAEGIIERQKSEYDTGRLQHIQPYKDLIAEIVFAKESIDRRVERLKFFVPEAGTMPEWTMFEFEEVDKPELESVRKGASAPLPRAESKEKSQEDRRFFSGPLPQPVDKEKAISRKKSTDKVERVDKRSVAGALPNAVQSLEKIVEQLIENPVNAKAVFGKGGKYRTELLGIKNLYLIEKMILAKGDKGEQLRREIRETGLLTSKHMLGTDEKIKGIKQLWQIRLKLLLDPGSAQQVLSSEETRALFKKFSDDAKLHIEDLIRMATGANEKFSVFEGDGMPVLRSALMKSGIFNVFESSVQRSFISKLEQHFEDAVVDKINDSAKLQEKLQDANFIDDLRANPSQIDRLEEISDITDEQKQVLGALRESANNKSGKWVKGDFYLALHGAVFKNKKLQEYLLARIEKLAAAGELPDVNTADSNALQNYIEQRLAKFSGEAGHGNYTVEVLAESRDLKKIAEKLFKLDEAEFYQAIGRGIPTKDENPALGGAATLAKVTAEEKKESTASILQNPWRVEDFVNALQGVEFQNEKLKQYLIEKVKKLPEEELPVLNTSEKVEALQRFITGRLAKFLGTEGVGNYGAMVVNDSLGVKDIAPKLFMLKGDEFYQALDIDAPEKGENLATGGAAALMEAVVVEDAPAAVVAPEMTEQQRNDPVVTDETKLIDWLNGYSDFQVFERASEAKQQQFRDAQPYQEIRGDRYTVKRSDGVVYASPENRKQNYFNSVRGFIENNANEGSVINFYVDILKNLNTVVSQKNVILVCALGKIDKDLPLRELLNSSFIALGELQSLIADPRFDLSGKAAVQQRIQQLQGQFEALAAFADENFDNPAAIDAELQKIDLSALDDIRKYIAARLGDQNYAQLIRGEFRPEPISPEESMLTELAAFERETSALPTAPSYLEIADELQLLIRHEGNTFKLGDSGTVVLKGEQLDGISPQFKGTVPGGEVIIRYFASGETNTIQLDHLIRRIDYLCNAANAIKEDGKIQAIRQKYIQFAQENLLNVHTETGEAFDKLSENAKKMFLELQKDLVAVAYPGTSLPKAIKALDKKVKEISIRDGRPTVIHVMADGMVSANIPKFSSDPDHPTHAKSYPGTYRSSEERGVTPNSALEVTGYINAKGNVEIEGAVSRSTSWSVLGLKGEKRQKLSYYQAEAELRNALSLMDLPDGATVNVHSMMLLTPVYRPSVEGIALVKVFYAGETEQMQNQIYSARMLDGKELELANGRKVTVNINVTNTSVKPPKRFMGLNEGVQEQVNNIGFAKFIKNQYESLVNAYPEHKKWLGENFYREPSEAIIKLEAELKAAYGELFDALETPAGKAAKAKVEKLEAQLSKAYGKHYEDVRTFWKAGGPAAADIPEALRQNKQFLYFADALKLYYSGDYVKQKTHAYLFVTAMTRANELAGVVVAKNCKTGKDRTKESVDQDNLALQYERNHEGKPLLSTSRDLGQYVAANLQTLREQGTGQEVIKYTVPGGLPVSMKDNEWEKKPARKTSKMSKCHKIRPSLRDIFNHWRNSKSSPSDKASTAILNLELEMSEDPKALLLQKFRGIQNKVLAEVMIQMISAKKFEVPEGANLDAAVSDINQLISQDTIMPADFFGKYKEFLVILERNGIVGINDCRDSFIMAIVAQNKSPIQEQDFAERIESATEYDELNRLCDQLEEAREKVEEYLEDVESAREALKVYLSEDSKEMKSLDAEVERLRKLFEKYDEQENEAIVKKETAHYAPKIAVANSLDSLREIVGELDLLIRTRADTPFLGDCYQKLQEQVQAKMDKMPKVSATTETVETKDEVVRISIVAERGVVNGSEKPKQDAAFVYRPSEINSDDRFEKISDKGKIKDALKSDDHVILVKNDSVSYRQPDGAEKLSGQQMKELVQKMVQETYARFKPEKASDITYEGSAELKKMARELMQAEIRKNAPDQKETAKKAMDPGGLRDSGPRG